MIQNNLRQFFKKQRKEQLHKANSYAKGFNISINTYEQLLFEEMVSSFTSKLK